MAESKAKKVFVVAHPRFSCRVEGKMKNLPKGTEISLTEAAAAKAAGRVIEKGKASVVSGGNLDNAEIKALKAKLEAAEKELAEAKKK